MDWQADVRVAYEDAQGGVFRYINLRTDEDIAETVPGRPEGCPVPPSDEGP